MRTTLATLDTSSESHNASARRIVTLMIVLRRRSRRRPSDWLLSLASCSSSVINLKIKTLAY
jgi:hypothetical protein